MKIIGLIKKKLSKPMASTEWFLESKAQDEGYNFQNDFIDAQNKHCAFESLSVFGQNTKEVLALASKSGGFFKMREFDDRVVYCVAINDHRADYSNRAILSIFGVVLDKRATQNYRFEDFKEEIKQKNANIIQQYPTVFDLAYQFPIKFSSRVHPATYDKNIPNHSNPHFQRNYYSDKNELNP